MVNTVINCNDSLITKIVFLKDNWIYHFWKHNQLPRQQRWRRDALRKPHRIVILVPLYSHHRIRPLCWRKTWEKHSSFVVTAPRRFGWQPENSCLGLGLSAAPLRYYHLMPPVTLSFGRRWGGYRTPRLNHFHLTPPPAIMGEVSFHISMSVRRALTDARALSEWHSDTFSVRDGQRADSQAARPDTEKPQSSYQIHLPAAAMLCFQGPPYRTNCEAAFSMDY